MECRNPHTGSPLVISSRTAFPPGKHQVVGAKSPDRFPPWGFPRGNPGRLEMSLFASPCVRRVPNFWELPPRGPHFPEMLKYVTVYITFGERSFQRSGVFDAPLVFLTCRFGPPQSRISPGKHLVFPRGNALCCRLSPGKHSGFPLGEIKANPAFPLGKTRGKASGIRRSKKAR